VTTALLLRIVAATAAISVVFTIWLILVIGTAGGFSALVRGGALGVLTLIGWAVTLALGPVTAVQLWRLKESGRKAGLILFGFGVVYYIAGFLWLRAPEAQTSQIAMAVIAYALPLVFLALPGTRQACT
jgi:hypothetical protein